MKKIVLISFLLFLAGASSFAQFAYIPDYGNGELNYTELAAPSNPSLVGVTHRHINASDFASDKNLYAISSDSLLKIDTTNASTTYLGSLPLPTGVYLWTGMAMDPTSGTLYISRTDGNNSDFLTLDVNTVTTTLIGSNTEADGVVGIAFDDNGQMYAIYLGQKFYKIDKTNGAATLVGTMTSVPVAGSYHGLDYCSENSTMYMTTYNSVTMNNELQTIDLATGSNTLVGNLVGRAGAMAVDPKVTIDFSADNTEVCEGSTVNFTDESTGGVTSWLWTFEGGTPATSTEQNPSVVYNNWGYYDVTLKISTISDTMELTKTDYITVSNPLSQPDKPEGPTETCGDQVYDYTTHALTGIAEYEWAVVPEDAGSISGSDTVGTFISSYSWSGDYIIKVRAMNTCGTTIWSDSLDATLNPSPEIFILFGGGGYCEGGQGRELKLDGSETGTNYELFLDEVSTGVIVAGTGDTISFGYQTGEGYYTATGNDGQCNITMDGQEYVYTDPLPGTPGTPTGPDMVCNNDTTDYTTTGATDSDTLVWVIDPADAGNLVYLDSLSVTVEWSTSFSGIAALSVYGSNACGDGNSSDALEITVNASPQPEIIGSNEVCEEEVADYSTDENPGNSYTWQVERGTITAGQGTHQITVQWENAGNGYVLVTEENSNCSATSDTLDVIVTICDAVKEYAEEDFSIYPNPVSNSLNVAFTAGFEGNIIVLDALGKVTGEAVTVDANTTHITMNTARLTGGIYYLRFTSREGNVVVKKFVKSK
jgi:PKD repeat protein